MMEQVCGALLIFCCLAVSVIVGTLLGRLLAWLFPVTTYLTHTSLCYKVLYA